ncbi:hypothetical protein [Bosea sp. ANAM02]|nr:MULTISPECIES: hypothetical protein [Hyphomicrobiales]
MASRPVTHRCTQAMHAGGVANKPGLPLDKRGALLYGPALN